MEKELKITPPEGYVIDEENSTFECIKFKKKELTYNDIVEKLFYNNNYYYTDKYGYVEETNTATFKKQLEKLFAINKLMNVAKYLNGYWKPNWEDSDYHNWYIGISCYKDVTEDKGELEIRATYQHITSTVYFKSQAIAQQAIDILGEDTIRLALSTDW